jgi:hypothetical protein
LAGAQDAFVGLVYETSVLVALDGTPYIGPSRKEERVLSRPKARFRSSRKLLRAVESVGIATPASETSKDIKFLPGGYQG